LPPGAAVALALWGHFADVSAAVKSRARWRLAFDVPVDTAALGADPVREVLTAGGGSRNDVWTEMRRRRLGGKVAVRRADNADAAFGAARLALRMHAQESKNLK
jgi:hypothetical protein